MLQEIYDKVREKFSSLEGSHDWFHIERVLQNARLIQEKEGGDLLIIELGALLHDIADHKFHDNDFEIGSKVAKSWVMEFFNNEELACKIEEIVLNIVHFLMKEQRRCCITQKKAMLRVNHIQ